MLLFNVESSLVSASLAGKSTKRVLDTKSLHSANVLPCDGHLLHSHLRDSLLFFMAVFQISVLSVLNWGEWEVEQRHFL